MADATSIAFGPSAANTDMLRATGGVACWGNNLHGQLCTGTTTDSPVPIGARRFADTTQLASCSDHTCARRSTGTVECWSSNTLSQLDDGTSTNSPSPIIVPGLTNVRAVRTGDLHACAIGANTSVYCRGDNFYGQVGNGTTSPPAAPTATSIPVLRLTSGVGLTLGIESSCAHLSTGGAIQPRSARRRRGRAERGPHAYRGYRRCDRTRRQQRSPLRALRDRCRRLPGREPRGTPWRRPNDRPLSASLGGPLRVGHRTRGR